MCTRYRRFLPDDNPTTSTLKFEQKRALFFSFGRGKCSNSATRKNEVRKRHHQIHMQSL